MKPGPSQGEAVTSLRARVSDLVTRAWQQATATGGLPALEPDDGPAIEIERPAEFQAR